MRLFKDPDFDAMMELALGACYHRGADVGEVLATADRIRNGDPESWFEQWGITAERIRTRAEASAAAGHIVSARRAFLRASTYYDAATFFIDRTKDADRFQSAWEDHRDCWNRAMGMAEPPVENVGIPYGSGTLPGFLFRQPDSEPRPLLVMTNGADGSITALWLRGVAGALARGYNCLAYDGPGQGAALFRDGLHFRHDWEAVVGPVLDWAVRRPEVDPDRIALLGLGQGGFWVLRAAAFEPRVTAVVADPGVWDVGVPWKAILNKAQLKLLEKGDRERFNRSINGARFGQAPRGALSTRIKPYGLETAFDVYKALESYNLEGICGRITCPVLATEAENARFWPGQPRQVYDAARNEESCLIRFAAAEGADHHGEPKALSVRDERIFDWLDTVLGYDRQPNPQVKV